MVSPFFGVGIFSLTARSLMAMSANVFCLKNIEDGNYSQYRYSWKLWIISSIIICPSQRPNQPEIVNTCGAYTMEIQTDGGSTKPSRGNGSLMKTVYVGSDASEVAIMS